MADFNIAIIDPRNESRNRIAEILKQAGFPCLEYAELPASCADLESSKQKIGGILLSLDFELEKVSSFAHGLCGNSVFKHVPLIGVLGNDAEAHRKLGPARRDFFHFLEAVPKKETLLHMVESILNSYRTSQELVSEIKKRSSAIGLISSGTFHLKTLNECEALTTMLSVACPDPSSVALGLSELLVNAVEHGNLGITYSEKTKLMEEGGWDVEVQKRLQDPSNANKNVEVKFRRDDEKICIQVTDDGEGFDWRSFLTENPVSATSRHGRGISLARAICFNSLEYNEKGNSVKAILELDAAC